MFTDRPTWTAAAAPNGSENFNSFATDTTFQNVSVPITNGTVIGQLGSNGAQTNKIDAPPAEFANAYILDGTSYLIGDLTAGQTMTITFNNPVTAWGGDFKGVADVPRTTHIDVFDAANVLQGTVTMSSPTNTTLGFYGFTMTAGTTAKKLVLSNGVASNDAFGLDNIQFSVPEPSAAAAIALLVPLSHRRRRIR
jgi:hypothetical protein